MEVFGHSTNVCIVKSDDGQSNRTKVPFEMKVLNINKESVFQHPPKVTLGSHSWEPTVQKLLFLS